MHDNLFAICIKPLFTLLFLKQRIFIFANFCCIKVGTLLDVGGLREVGYVPLGGRVVHVDKEVVIIQVNCQLKT